MKTRLTKNLNLKAFLVILTTWREGQCNFFSYLSWNTILCRYLAIILLENSIHHNRLATRGGGRPPSLIKGGQEVMKSTLFCNLAIPELLDAVQQQLMERFTKSSISASKLLGLDPKCMVSKTSQEMISSLSSCKFECQWFLIVWKTILESQLLT